MSGNFGQEAAFALTHVDERVSPVDDMQAAARPDPARLVRTREPTPDEQADTEAAVRWLGEHYATNDRLARILLGQAAHQDGVSAVEAARRLISDLEGQRTAAAGPRRRADQQRSETAPAAAGREVSRFLRW